MSILLYFLSKRKRGEEDIKKEGEGKGNMKEEGMGRKKIKKKRKEKKKTYHHTVHQLQQKIQLLQMSLEAKI